MLRNVLGLILGLYAVAQGCWVLIARPDPPPSAKTATRASRRAIAIAAIIIGIAYIVIQLSDLF